MKVTGQWQGDCDVIIIISIWDSIVNSRHIFSYSYCSVVVFRVYGKKSFLHIYSYGLLIFSLYSIIFFFKNPEQITKTVSNDVFTEKRSHIERLGDPGTGGNRMESVFFKYLKIKRLFWEKMAIITHINLKKEEKY